MELEDLYEYDNPNITTLVDELIIYLKESKYTNFDKKKKISNILNSVSMYMRTKADALDIVNLEKELCKQYKD